MEPRRRARVFVLGLPARCEAAGIPGHLAFATKPQLARLMIERAVSARVPFA